MRARWFLLGMAVWLPVAACAAAQAPTADEVLRKAGVSRGIGVVVGDVGGRLALDLARQSDLMLLVLVPDAPSAAKTCQAVYQAGLYGTRIFVEQLRAGQIGLADNLADVVVLLGKPGGHGWPGKDEVLRVLRPQGIALAGGQVWSKPFPEGIDEWTHHYHRADNNPQSQDRLARAPYLTQYIAEPRYAPAPQAAVAAGGRIFMAFGHVAWHQREEPWLNTLVAMNAFNGTILWKRPLVRGIMVDRSTMIATGDALYVADDTSCKILDPATGAVRGEIAVPAAEAGGTFWKWMALEDGVLYALIGPDEPRDPDAKWRSTNHGWPWDAISRGYNEKDYRWGFGPTLAAIDPKTRRVLWIRHEDIPIDSRSLCMKNGRIYYCSFGQYIVCRDARTGNEIWRRTKDKDPEVFQAIGPYRPGHGYIGGWKSTAYVKCTDQALYFVGPQVHWLTTLSAADGRVLWRHEAIDLHIVIREDGLYTIGPQNSTDRTRKLDPLSGKILAQYHTFRRACTRSTGTVDGIFFRGHEGSGRLDLASGQVQWVSPMRPSCHVGVVVAHGQLYWLPWACDCNLQMFGAIALSPARDFRFDQKATEADRLEIPDSQALDVHQALTISPQDWPTHRADNRRTAKTQATVPSRIARRWQFQPKAPVEMASPVMAGGLVFVAGADGVVHALDAASGNVRWTLFTGGPVRYPPSIADGRAFVGSSDGWVYAVEAATGRLLWRFRAAPAPRRIPVYGALLSTWPVAGGVLVENGVAYFAAGLNDLDGTHVYALDAKSGRIRWQNNSAGHLDAFSRRGVTCQGEMLLYEGKLYLAGGNTVSPAIFDIRDGKCLNPPPTGMGSRAPRGRELHLVNSQVTVSGQPLYSRPEAPVFDPSVRWTRDVVEAGNATLFCQRRPGTDQWVLVAQDRASNQPLWTEPLPGEPIRWPVALDAQGRIVVVLRSGQVLGLLP